MKETLLLLSTLVTTLAFSQVADTETLNANDVSAIVADEGYFFNDAQNSTHGYDIPAGTGLGTFYAASIWAGGLNPMGQLQLTAPSSTNVAWRSGPIADNASYGTTG